MRTILKVEQLPNSVPTKSDHSGRLDAGIDQMAFGQQRIMLVCHHEHSEYTDVLAQLDTYNPKLADQVVHYLLKLVAKGEDPLKAIDGWVTDWSTNGGDYRIRLDNKPSDSPALSTCPSPIKELVSSLIELSHHLERLAKKTGDPVALDVARRNQLSAVDWIKKLDSRAAQGAAVFVDGNAELYRARARHNSADNTEDEDDGPRQFDPRITMPDPPPRRGAV